MHMYAIGKMVTDTMDYAGAHKGGAGKPTIDSITNGIRNIPIHVDSGYPSSPRRPITSPGAGGTKPMFGNR